MGDDRKKPTSNDVPENGIPKPFPKLGEKLQHIDAKNIYALLIGIDHYDSGENQFNLKGCVRDSIEMERYLKETVEAPHERLHLRKLRSHLKDEPARQLDMDVACVVDEELEATRQIIISSMLEFLTQAEEGDIVLIHYSGHGSREKRPEKLLHLDINADGWGESIICSDSFTQKDGQAICAIRDLELRWMLHQITQTNPHLLFISDCCNATGNTRVIGKNVQVRTIEAPDEEDFTKVEDYVFYQQDDNATCPVG